MEKTIPHQLWTVKLGFHKTLSGDLPERIATALEEVVTSVFLHNKEPNEGDDWEITLTNVGEPNLEEIFRAIGTVDQHILDTESVMVEQLPETDWLQQVHENFPPVTIGRFFVYGSHYEGETPAKLIPLKIDAATAFGSGEHETTKGCMQAFEFLLEDKKCDFKNALDMGCGSGILAIALRKLWPEVKLTAVDIDPESIIVTERHAEMNNVTDVTTEAGDGYHAQVAQSNAPYDIVASNILSGPLIEMAPQLANVIAPRGYCVLSGLLNKQKDDVVKAHEQQGLTLVHAESIGEWQALVMQKEN